MYEELVKRLRAHNGWAKTLDAAADAIEELDMKIHGANAAIAGMQREIERMVIDSANSKPQWIPVTERLPENEVEVLVVRRFLGDTYCPPNTYVETAKYCYGDWVADSDEYKIARCLHTDPLFWMPIPEPPKEEE